MPAESCQDQGLPRAIEIVGQGGVQPPFNDPLDASSWRSGRPEQFLRARSPGQLSLARTATFGGSNVPQPCVDDIGAAGRRAAPNAPAPWTNRPWSPAEKPPPPGEGRRTSARNPRSPKLRAGPPRLAQPAIADRQSAHLRGPSARSRAARRSGVSSRAGPRSRAPQQVRERQGGVQHRFACLAPCRWRTRLSGSSPSGSRRNAGSIPGFSSGRARSATRKAARWPRRVAVEAEDRLGRQTPELGDLVLGQGRAQGATAAGKPPWASAMTSM